jgi:hypothetical protein
VHIDGAVDFELAEWLVLLGMPVRSNIVELRLPRRMNSAATARPKKSDEMV